MRKPVLGIRRPAVAFLFAAGLGACSPGSDAPDSSGEPGAARPAPHPDGSPNARFPVHAPPGPLGAAPEDGEGTVRILPDDPVVAGSWGSWTVEWRAGESGIAPGGGVVLQVSPFWGWTPPQTTRPGRPGYTTVSCTRPSVTLDVADGAVPMTVVARVAGGGLAPGDTVRFVYGDSSAGGAAGLARADRYAEAFEELLVKTDGNGDGWFEPPPDQPTLEILPGPPAFLAVAAPALVGPGESFELGVVGLDAQGSWAELSPGRISLRLRPLDATGDSAAALAESTLTAPSRRIVFPVAVATAGLYRLEAFWDAGAARLAGRNDLLLVESGSPFREILWGDIHSHSALSDGTGAPEDLYRYARDVAALDVASVTDHDAHGLFPLEGDRWERVVEAARGHHDPGQFVTILGYEWTSWTWGHRNVYFPGASGEVFGFRSLESDSPGKLWERIASWGAITIPHHPAGGPVAVDWSVPSPEERERVVEICSIHGSSEAPGVERAIYRPVPGAFVRDAFDRGHRLGILAAGDTHDGHPGRRTVGAPTNGLAAFRAGKRTRRDVLAAIRERRVYGTSGPRVLLASDWGGARPGADLPQAPAGPVRVRVAAPEPVQVIEIVDSGGVLASAYGGGRRVERMFFEESPAAPRGSWLYVRVVLADGEVAWDSPWWIGSPGS